MTNFDFQMAMRNLGIKARPFARDEDDCRGYSKGDWFAINPTEEYPEFVAFHEWTHILLGHTTMYRPTNALEDMLMREHKERHHDLKEAECHATAIFTAVLTGTKFDLDFEIWHMGQYTKGRKLPDDIKARALQTAVKIAKAGGMRSDQLMDRRQSPMRQQVAA